MDRHLHLRLPHQAQRDLPLHTPQEVSDFLLVEKELALHTSHQQQGLETSEEGPEAYLPLHSPQQVPSSLFESSFLLRP